MRRPLVRVLASAAAVAGGIALAATPALASQSAPADTLITVAYPVSGSTYIKAINTTVSLGAGTLTSTADLNTSATSSTLSLPAATASFRELGFIPVTATTELVQDGAATGTVNFSTNAVQTTSQTTLKLTGLKVAGIPIPVGSSCQTKSPATITVSSQPGFNILSGGVLSGSYTIPPFAHCGLATFLINLTLPGSGNTISLTVGAGTIQG
jgi:hypothetical protein